MLGTCCERFGSLRVLGLTVGLLLALPVAAQEAPGEAPPPAAESKPAAEAASLRRPGDAQKSICLLLESAARAHGLPIEFFARVIWQESRFRADAVGPITRSGKRALGIAQFMPGTAAERNLLNPFDPIQALPKSAEFLQELRREFGNLGLAAAAYNAGPRRVREWLAGTGPMPAETRAYVRGHHRRFGRAMGQGLGRRRPQAGAGAGVRRADGAAQARAEPFVAALEQRVVVGAMQPWGVILGGDMSRVRILDRYAALQQRHAAVLAGIGTRS